MPELPAPSASSSSTYNEVDVPRMPACLAEDASFGNGSDGKSRRSSTEADPARRCRCGRGRSPGGKAAVSGPAKTTEDGAWRGR